MGYKQSQNDHTLFIKHSKSGGVTALLVYMDDIIVTGNDLKEREALICQLAKEFEIKNPGKLNEDVAVDKGMYQRLVGRLIYLSHTRPNIAYAVGVISQFMHNPKETHLQLVHTILHYLKSSPRKGILFKKGTELTLEAYTDADYAGSMVNTRSTLGYCTFIGGNLVTWRSKKQTVVARSSTESEFRAMAHGVCELLWLKIILDDFKVRWD
ncbi:Retrovirus-related Pol polyprotein from transposon RE1 [Vitis vinifera]|uniref:Retrovirus-related Pol polyprotein from transposon RE1 n=1 Tax=Vitis vinifera TaxID=29760 RepID=A0A438DVP6_VITVI|nr:Retrovirus-related Pol polyprotein from transposon RE1 [Vitis vinifera]